MFENITDSKFELIETKTNPMNGISYHHVKLYYSDKKTLFFDGWVDEYFCPFLTTSARTLGLISEDKAFPLTKYKGVPSGTEVQIALAKPEDKGEIQDLYYQYYFDGDTGPIGALAATTLKIDDDHQIWYVRAGNEIVAAVYFYDGVAYGHNETLYIDNLYVHPNYRGKGIGSALINSVAHTAKARGKKGLCLIVMGTPDMIERTVEFYNKNGFYVEEDEDGEQIVTPLDFNGERVRLMMFGWFER